MNVLRTWLLFVLLACGIVSPAGAAEKVTLRLDWSYWGGHAPYFIALEKGYWAKRGLDVVVQDGKGSRTTAILVGEGKDDFGVADSTSVANAISQGSPSKVVAVLMAKNPNGIVFLDSAKIKEPKDLEGKTLGSTAGGSDATLLEAFLTKGNVDVSKVRIEKMPGDAKPAALMAGKVDAISSQGFYNMPIMEAQGAKLRELLFADYGLPGLNYGIFTSRKMIEEKPQIVKAFVGGALEGWNYALAHMDEAIAILKKHQPLLDPKVARQQLVNFQGLLHTKNTEGKPIGWQSIEDWNGTLDVLEKYAGMKGRLPAQEYFTNAFIENN